MKPQFMRRCQVMDELGIGERTFRKLVSAEKLNPVRFCDEHEQPYYMVAEVEKIKNRGEDNGV